MRPGGLTSRWVWRLNEALIRNGAVTERILLLVFSLLAAMALYYAAVDLVDPSRNVLRLSFRQLSGAKYTIYTGEDGGWYKIMGNEIAKASPRIKTETTAQASHSALQSVLDHKRAIAIVQSDVLNRAHLSSEEVRVTEPLYDERLHILYRTDYLKPDMPDGSVPNKQDPADGGSASAPLITLKPGMGKDFQEQWVDLSVRLALSKPPTGTRTLPDRILELCGLHLKNGGGYGEITEAIKGLKKDKEEKGAFQVVFITTGARIEDPEHLLKWIGKHIKKRDPQIGLMSIDPKLVRDLNRIFKSDYRESSFFNIYHDELDRVKTLATSAVLVTSPDVPASVITMIAELMPEIRNNFPNGTTHIPLDEYPFKERILRRYDQTIFEKWIVGFALIGILVAVLYSAMIWLTSSMKQVIYFQRITSIYRDNLPQNVQLKDRSSGARVPLVDGSMAPSHDLVRHITEGISELLDIAMRIRHDYGTGGITVAHEGHLTRTVYAIKEIFQRHLAQRLHQAVLKQEGYGEDDLTNYYTAGYILREDYQFLQRQIQLQGQPFQHRREE